MTLAIVGHSTKLVENPGKGRRAREEKGASIIEDNKLVSEDFLLHTIHKHDGLLLWENLPALSSGHVMTRTKVMASLEALTSR